MVLEKTCIINGMYKWYSIVDMYYYNCSGTVASLQLLSRLLQLLSFYKSCHITFLQLITSYWQLVQLLNAAFSDWMALNWKVYCLSQDNKRTYLQFVQDISIHITYTPRYSTPCFSQNSDQYILELLTL